MANPGDELRRLRKLRDLTLEKVAREVGFSPQALSQLETGVTKYVRPENFLRLCAFYEVDPYRLIFGVDRSRVVGQIRSKRMLRGA